MLLAGTLDRLFPGTDSTDNEFRLAQYNTERVVLCFRMLGGIPQVIYGRLYTMGKGYWTVYGRDGKHQVTFHSNFLDFDFRGRDKRGNVWVTMPMEPSYE